MPETEDEDKRVTVEDNLNQLDESLTGCITQLHRIENKIICIDTKDADESDKYSDGLVGKSLKLKDLGIKVTQTLNRIEDALS